MVITKLGNKIIAIKTRASGIINGMMALISFSMGKSLISVITKRIIPIGGVMSPILRLTTITTPK